MHTDQVQATVLNVDGDAQGQRAVSRALKLGGHLVIEAGTGREAVRLARAQRPDLIVLDVNLPDVTGFEVVAQLKADPATAPIPVLHLSSTAVDPDSVVRGLERGADAYLTEPVEEEVLLATVRALIRMGRAQREAAEARADAELRLQETEAIFEAASSPIIVYDGAGRPVRANPTAVAAWGFDPVAVPRVEAARRLALRYPNGVPVPAEELPTTRALRGDVVYRERYLYTDASGQEHVVLHSVAPLRDGDEVRGAVAVWHDVTEEDRAARVLAEAYEQLQQVNEERETALEEMRAASEELEVANEELQASQDQLEHEQARLRAVLDALPVTVAIAEDPGCHVITLNPAGARLYGVEPGTNVSATPPMQEPVPVRHYAQGRELRPRELPMQRAAAEGAESRDVELNLRMPDGRQVTVLCNAVPIRDQDRRVTGAVATVTDITARKQAEQERERLLAEVERQRMWLDTVLENTDALLVFLDRDFNFLHVNAAYARAGRKAPEEYLGHNHFELYPHEANEAIFRRVRDTGEPFSIREKPFEYPGMPERGVTYWDWTLTPIRGEAGRVEYLVFSLVDVTEQVRMRQRLVEAERGRAEIAERMTAEINHRMKNNLMLLTSVMQMQLVSLPPRTAAADAIQDAMARIASLSVVHEHLYQGQSGKVELRDVLRRVGDVVGHALAAQRVAVTVSGEECYVSSKLGSTLAILANELITNAMKYGGPGGDGLLKIAVSLARADGQLRLRVWNSGSPIAGTFDLARQSGMGLDLVQGVVTGQLDGAFAIHPHEGGTVAEISFGEDVLVERGVWSAERHGRESA